MAYKFQSTKTVPSKVCPGVTFTFRIITEAMKNSVRASLVDALSELRDAQGELEAALARRQDEDQALTAAESAAHMKAQDKAFFLTQTKIDPEWLRAAFVSVDGLDIDDVPFSGTADDLIAKAPSELTVEIEQAIKESIQLREVERKNSESSTISGAAVDGATSDTTASSASAPDSTAPATVASSTQN